MARRRSGVSTPAPMFDVDTGPRAPVAPESFYASQSKSNIDWGGMVGSNPDNPRFTSQTPNGAQSNEGNGHNQRSWSWGPKSNGDRWSPPVDWAKNGGNRTGE